MPSGIAKPPLAMATLKAASAPSRRTTAAAMPGRCPPREPDHHVTAVIIARIAADGGSAVTRKANANAAMPQGLHRPGSAQQATIEATIQASQDSSRICILERVAHQ